MVTRWALHRSDSLGQFPPDALGPEDAKLRTLRADLGQIGYLAWSPDSSYVYFDTALTPNPAYYRVHITDAKLEHLVDLKGIRTFPEQFGPGSWTGPGPDRTPIFVRDLSRSASLILRGQKLQAS